MRTIGEIREVLGTAMNDYIAKNYIPGIAVGVVLDGQAAFTEGFGVKNVTTGDKLDSKSMFHCASISKTFVATSIMQLYERKLIDLDKTVAEYLPYFKLSDERYNKITIRQMLTHTAGMPDVDDYEWEKPQYEDKALEGYVRSLNDKELLWEPGAGFAYSNMAYEVLGDLISKVSGLSFEDYVKENIFRPLGMNCSSHLIKDIPADIITSPHVENMEKGYELRVNGFYPYNRIHAPSSTLWSNVEEMCLYAMAGLNKGKLGNFELLKESSYDAMWQPYADRGRNNSKVGLCWFLRPYKDVNTIYHTGGDVGYRSNIVLIPEKSAAFIVLCNGENMDIGMITDYLLDVILGYEMQPLKSSIVPKLAQTLYEQGYEAAEALLNKTVDSDKGSFGINEAELNYLSYSYKNNNRLEDGIAILQMAVGKFPEASNLYDSMGELYVAKGDKVNAIRSYKRSLELNPNNGNAIGKLKSLGEIV